MSSTEVSDDADSELPSTEVPTTESDVKTQNVTSSTIATASSPSGSTSASQSNSADASASGSSSSVKKSDDDDEGSSSPTTGSTGETTGETTGEATGDTTTTTGETGGSDEKAGGDDDKPPPRPKPAPRPKLPKPPPPSEPVDQGDVDPTGDISMQYEKKFKVILARKNKEDAIANAYKLRNKPNINELNAYYKAWVLGDFEKQREKPKSHEKEKKRRQDEVRRKKAEEAFNTWMQYKKQQLKMERRCFTLQQKEHRQLVHRRSRAASEAAYDQWLADKRHQHSLAASPRSSAPPVVHTRDMSALAVRSYKAALAGPRRRHSANCSRRNKDDYYDVENVYCPEHRTEYQLETKRTTGGSCYRLTSVRKLSGST